MSRLPLVLFPAVLAACGAPPPSPAGTTDSDPFTYTLGDDDDDDDTTWTPPNSDEASLILFLTAPDTVDPQPSVALGGVFVETRRGYENLAQCVAFTDTFCVEALPEVPDDFVPADPFDSSLLDDLLARDVGPSVQLGPYVAPAIQAGALRAYFDPAGGAFPEPGAPLDLSFGPGDWGDVSVTGAIHAPTPLEITSPATDQLHTFTDQAIPFAWTPGGEGEVYLSVVTMAERRLYLLEDDGSFDLSLATLPLADGDSVDLALSRWNTEVVDVEGHEIALHAQYDQWFHGTFRDVGGRIELIAPDTCQDALAAVPVVPGAYWGELQGYLDDLNPGVNGCTSKAAGGKDGIFPYVMAPNEFVFVTQTMPNDDASVYLMTDCDAPGSCLDGADVNGQGGTETATWFNDSDAELPIWIVVDSNGANNDLYELDITSTVLQTDLLLPSCVDAMAAPTALPGAYTGDIGSNLNNLNPVAYCGVDAPGGEGLVRVELQSGETLTATANMAGSNTVLYLLYNCSVVASCAETADALTGASETVVYTNTSLGSEIVYLVVDAADFTGQYIVDIQIN